MWQIQDLNPNCNSSTFGQDEVIGTGPDLPLSLETIKKKQTKCINTATGWQAMKDSDIWEVRNKWDESNDCLSAKVLRTEYQRREKCIETEHQRSSGNLSSIQQNTDQHVHEHTTQDQRKNHLTGWTVPKRVVPKGSNYF